MSLDLLTARALLSQIRPGPYGISEVELGDSMLPTIDSKEGDLMVFDRTVERDGVLWLLSNWQELFSQIEMLQKALIEERTKSNGILEYLHAYEDDEGDKRTVWKEEVKRVPGWVEEHRQAAREEMAKEFPDLNWDL